MRVLDLFSGIGGFSLGLERAGMQTVAFCECEPYAQAVLRKHWPDVPCYEDVRTLNADRLAADGIAVDVICGGFPCQDISLAGDGAGLAGERSGLWSEIARLVGELRPRYVIVENVSALLGRGLGRVLGDLAEIGYDAEWHCIPASAVGAPHRRDRVWLVAYPRRDRGGKDAEWFPNASSAPGIVLECEEKPKQGNPDTIPDTDRPRLEGGLLKQIASAKRRQIEGDGCAPECGAGRERDRRSWGWRTEPDVGRVAHGVPSRVDRLRCLGNAVVPQIPEIIGRAIMSAEGRA
jgi:DNA (cytosine-5)-methyltransferase 1